MGNEADDELDRAGADEQPADEPQQQPPAAHSNGDGPSAEYDYVDPADEVDEPVLSDAGAGAGEGVPPVGGEPADEAAPRGEAGPLGEIGSEDGRNWFVIHCYSGYENKVRHNLEQRIESMGMKGKIFDVVVPTEEEIEVKDGKRRTVERRVFPGYLLVQMIMSEDSWYVVRNTPGVTGFVGMGNVPTPLRPEEVAQILRRMEAEAPKVKVTFKPSQKVRIVDGPFNDFIGTVAEIDMDRAKVRVMVSFFGRETPVELDFLQVEKV
jgi:transcriptional antiterminator NusG